MPETQANFVWLRLGERTLDFAAACEQAGVVVRPFAGEGVRVTIGETEANDLFLQGGGGVPQGALGRSVGGAGAEVAGPAGAVDAGRRWRGAVGRCDPIGYPPR